MFSEDEDEEAQLLLSKPSRDIIERSKRAIRETREIGTEVLRSLEADNEKIRTIKRKQDQVSNNTTDADRIARSIERGELIQFVFVCTVLFLVVLGMFIVLIRMMLKKVS